MSESTSVDIRGDAKVYVDGKMVPIKITLGMIRNVQMETECTGFDELWERLSTLMDLDTVMRFMAYGTGIPLEKIEDSSISLIENVAVIQLLVGPLVYGKDFERVVAEMFGGDPKDLDQPEEVEDGATEVIPPMEPEPTLGG